MATLSARRVGRNTLVNVSRSSRSDVLILSRADDGKFYDADRLEVSPKNFMEAVQSVGRVVARSLDKSRAKVVFKTLQNGVWIDFSMLAFEIECSSCGGDRPIRGFGEKCGYCASCLAAD